MGIARFGSCQAQHSPCSPRAIKATSLRPPSTPNLLWDLVTPCKVHAVAKTQAPGVRPTPQAVRSAHECWSKQELQASGHSHWV